MSLGRNGAPRGSEVETCRGMLSADLIKSEAFNLNIVAFCIRS